MRLRTKLVLTATGVTFAMVLVLSAAFLSELNQRLLRADVNARNRRGLVELSGHLADGSLVPLIAALVPLMTASALLSLKLMDTVV